MARRINIYSLIRKIHLYSALGLMVFLLMYFVTGWMMTHESLFSKEKPPSRETTHAFSLPGNLSEEEMSVRIQDEFHLNGKRGKHRSRGDSLVIFPYQKPGMDYQAHYYPARQEIVIREEPQTAHRTLVIFHRIHGYGGGWLYTLYVLLMDLTSFACILFAITGTYLWFKLLKVKWLGVVILVGSLVYMFVVIGQLMALSV